MNNKLVKWPSIVAFRNVVADVRFYSRFTGALDAEGNPVLDESRPIASLPFKGTVKIHGVNSAVVLPIVGDDWFAQGREISLSASEHGYGFYPVVAESIAVFRALRRDALIVFGDAAQNFVADHPAAQFVVYGEWCGSGVQSKVAVSRIPNTFVIFKVGIAGNLDEDKSRDFRPFLWLNDEDAARIVARSRELSDLRLYHVDEFPTYHVTIPFDAPEAVLAQMEALTAAVEKQCPVGAHFGAVGSGEGIVWMCEDPNWAHPRFWFKLKGTAHKTNKFKESVAADPLMAASLADFVDKTVTEVRLQQAQSYLEARGEALSPETIGSFVQWVVADVLKEEGDIVKATGLDERKLKRAISEAAKTWLFDQPSFKV